MANCDDLIPVRALNQVTYCERLYYLEYVESIMPVNEHVEDGLFQHRRVDAPELQNRSRKEGDALQIKGFNDFKGMAWCCERGLNSDLSQQNQWLILYFVTLRRPTKWPRMTGPMPHLWSASPELSVANT